MTPDGFRRVALGLEGASESAHHGHPDFRVGGRIFATLGYPDRKWGMVNLTPDQQRTWCVRIRTPSSRSRGHGASREAPRYGWRPWTKRRWARPSRWPGRTPSPRRAREARARKPRCHIAPESTRMRNVRLSRLFGSRARARLIVWSGAWLSGRAFASHARGRWFDSTRAHHPFNSQLPSPNAQRQAPKVPAGLLQREPDLDRHAHGHSFAVLGPRLEQPLLDRFDGLRVEAVLLVEDRVTVTSPTFPSASTTASSSTMPSMRASMAAAV